MIQDASRWASSRLTFLALLAIAIPVAAQKNSGVSHSQFLHGRSTSTAAQSLDLARRQHLALLAQPRSSLLSAAWASVGPNQVATIGYGNVTGRISAIEIDPADTTGNTVYLGTTGGGVWKSVNATGPAASVTFTPLTDTLSVFDSSSQTIPSLSIGAIAIANGVLLAGTGDPNDATDSYYGAGILRSADGGTTWTLAQRSNDGVSGNHEFFGLSVTGIAFSSLNPTLAVAALSQSAEGTLVNAVSGTNSQMGLYYTADAGLTWHLATVLDGNQIVQSPNIIGTSGNPATSVVWNPIRHLFLAALSAHGYYSSPDAITWTRLSNQPGVGISTTACPSSLGPSATTTCPISRGVLTVQPASGDTFALTVDATNHNQGLYQDVCASSGTACTNAVTFANHLNASPLQQTGTTIIPQADYNLTLAATPSGTDTLLFVGTTDLYRCSLAAGCVFRNTTNSQNGCTNPALVAPAQHAIATLNSLLYLGNDGGLWRSTDGVNQTAPPCSLDDANHFQNLNAGLGSLAEVVSFAQSPVDPAILFAGLGALGSAGNSTSATSWPQLSSGEGGTVAIDPTNPSLWYLSTGAGLNVARCTAGPNCTPASFAATVIGAAQTASDPAAIHAAWLLDPGFPTNLLAGTCRTWRGAATGGALWSATNLLSRPYGTPSATACGSASPVVRSLAAGGAINTSSSSANSGSRVLYAGLAGSSDGGQGFGGRLFVTTAANLASGSTAWTDAASSPVTNDPASAGVFNPGGFDISSIAVDPHDATGATVYATVMGFAGNNISAPHLYRSTDSGAHWANISANLPNAPANSVVVDPNDANTLYLALDTGVYVTTQVTTCTTTNCWSVYGASLPNAPVIQLQAASAMPTGDGRTGELRAATYGRGIWQIPLLTAATPAAPAIAINPTTVTYSAQQVGTASLAVTITVTNTGTAPLNVRSIATAGDFYQTNTCIGTPVAINAMCTLQLTFLPTLPGTRTGLVTIYANVSGGQATAALSGTGTPAAAIVLTPTALTFPSTNIGATSPVQTITISNTGGTPATLQAPFVTGDFSLSANSCGTSLTPSTGCTLSISFVPTASGTRFGTFTVVDSTGTQVATLTGLGTNPATDTLNPLALSFAAQQLGTTSPSQQLTLTNAGDVALTLVSAQITAGDFVAVSSCGNSLAAHSICAIAVTYSPKAVGPQIGTMSIADQFRSQTVALSGTGLAPPGVSLSPSNGLAFAPTGVGLTSTSQTVTLTNNGGGPLALSSITATGDYAILVGSNTCGTSVAPAAVCTVQIVFSPTSPGLRTGTVTFSDNATSSPQSLAFSGIGVDFSLASNGPASLTVASGQTATYALLLTSAAGLPGTVAFTCAGVPAHSTCTVNPGTTALGGTTNISVTVATGLSTAAVRPLSLPWTHELIWLALLLPLGFVRRRHRPLWPALLLLIAVAGCSTGRIIPASTLPVGNVFTTPSGTYTLVVAGSSAGLVHAVSLTLVVQ